MGKLIKFLILYKNQFLQYKFFILTYYLIYLKIFKFLSQIYSLKLIKIRFLILKVLLYFEKKY